MAKSKDDIKYGVAQAKLSEDEALRVAYKHGTPLESGKIADSDPVDLFSSARKISRDSTADRSSAAAIQSQPRREDPDNEGGRESDAVDSDPAAAAAGR